MNWLITGGAGYIGAHIADLFQREGLNFFCYDNLSTGLASRISDKQRLIIGDIDDETKFARVIKEMKISGVIHLAAKKSVSESRINPPLYEQINFEATKSILDICVREGVSSFIFSSTAAVYGESHLGYVSESADLSPISPYGATKLKAENILTSYVNRDLLQGISLRYFNVIGQSNSMLKDESKDNLLPRVLDAVRQRIKPQVFGNDYPTPDGTCVRDYVDVRDIASLHLKLCRNLESTKIPLTLNVGTGIGVSVLEVMESIYSRLNLELITEILPRRIGDPPKLVADVRKMHQELQFTTQHNFVESVESLIL